jgi:peptidyl-tRNA hydrolase
MRSDLEMKPGKLASQAAHCAAKSLIEYLHANLDQAPTLIAQFRALGKSGSRIALKAKNLGHVERAYREAKAAGLPVALFSDEGHIVEGTAFDGGPVITGLGIGPCLPSQARPITKRFNCIE